jgi:hypothetical protein
MVITQNPRRVFMLQLVCVGSVLAATRALAQDKPISTEKLTEKDGYARSMGFKLDTSQVDAKRYPRHTADQNCANCQLFSGKEGEEWGPCSFFGGRLVHKNGWCRNYKVRKAA